MLKERMRKKALQNLEQILREEGKVIISEREYINLKAMDTFIRCIPNGLLFKKETEDDVVIEPLSVADQSTIYASLMQIKRCYEDIKELIPEDDAKYYDDVIRCLSYVSPEL